MLTIDAGTSFESGCTPDGACWPSFVSHRACEVRFFKNLPKKGLALSSPEKCVIWVRRNPQAGEGWSNNPWLIEDIIAHEVGHDNCVTTHKDGSTHCWRNHE